MIGDKKVLALIPARGGSKGIKHKNIYPIMGKPLIGYTIEAALECSYIDKVLVSTDDEDIAKVSKEYGAQVPFMRPDYLSSDTAKSIDVVMHAIDFTKSEGYEVLVLLQPTSPFRDAGDITGALKEYLKTGSNSLVSVSEVTDNPVLIRTINENGQVEKLLDSSSTVRRQDMKKYYRVNGAIYINSIADISSETSLNDNLTAYVMDKSHSVDIDEMTDIYYAEALIKSEN